MRLWLAALLICAVTLPVAAQRRKKPSNSVPGTVTITSFDKDHTVIGWLEIVPFESKIFHNKRMLRVLVPANYLSPHNAHRSYPVLYMQDGQSLFDTSTSSDGEWHMDETVEQLVGSFKIDPMFVVGIDNAGEERSAEYLPYPDEQNPKVADEKSVRGREYARFLTTEVMPFIQKHYRVARGAANTGLGGSSYGANITLYAGLKYPATFGHVLVESGALWVSDNQLLKDAQKAKTLPRKMYIGVGTSEAPYDDAKQSPRMVEAVQELETILRKKGMGPTRLKVVVEEGAAHNPAAWSKRLPEALLFLYGR